MRFYRNVFQFMGGKKVYSKTLQAYQTDDNPDSLYHQIDDVKATIKIIISHKIFLLKAPPCSITTLKSFVLIAPG